MYFAKQWRQCITPMWGLVFVVCLALGAPPPTAAQAADESALRALLERFFAAYQKKDMAGLTTLWSKAAPDSAAGEQEMRRTLDNEEIRLNRLAVPDVRVEGDKASARVVADLSAVDAKPGAGATGRGRKSYVFHFVREGGEWKIWRYVSGEEDLAEGLVGAKTEAERRALLEERRESVSGGLVKELLKQGRGLYVRGEFATALDIADLTLSIAKQVGDQAGVVTSLRMIGNIHAGRGEYTQALEYYRNSLGLAEQLGDKIGIAGAFNNFGNLYDLLGDGAKASEYFQRSLSIASEINHLQLQALALNNLGNIYKAQGDNLRALEYFQRSLRLAEKMGDKEAVGRALLNIGTVHSAQGNSKQALEFYQKSLAIEEELGERAEVNRILGNIGLAKFNQGEYDSALDYHRKALKTAEELEDREVVTGSLNNIGDVYVAQHNYAKALEYYQRALTLAEATGNKLFVASALQHIAEVHLQLGDYRQAVEQADRSAALARQADLPSPLWSSRTIAGKAHLALNRPDLARQSLLDAISTIERLREHVAGGGQERERFFEDKVAPYYTMVDLSLTQNNYYEALDYGDRAKSRVLADVLSGGRVDIEKAMTAGEREREQELNNQLVALNRQLYREKTGQQPAPSRLADLDARVRRARLEYEAFETSLYAAHPELKLHRGHAPSLTPERMAELLPDAKTALLEFVVNDEKAHLFVLTRGQGRGLPGGVELKVYRLAVKGKDLTSKVEDFRRRLAERDPEFRDPARQLYDLLLKPAAGQLRGKTLLCIVPDGVLWDLPFQALQPREGSYLIEEHALFYAPSLGVLYGVERARGKGGAASTRDAEGGLTSRGRGAVRPEPTLFAIGNPAVGREVIARVSSLNRDEGLGPLPEAEHEVRTLVGIYKPANSSVRVGAEAREALAKAEMGKYRVLHFATHGVLDDLNPMYSHLVLSLSDRDDGEDGLLHAWELMRLDLKADIVVLSACQTARGRLGAGEGVVGMSWALFIAGSPTTVASQWSVESSSTTQLMVEFHRSLLSRALPRGPRPTKAEALRRASLSVLKHSRYAHPFYWAGFVLVGDGMRPL